MSAKTQTRRTQIVELARQHSIVSIDALVDSLGVSAQTIRRDLNRLYEDDILRRRHGGAEFPGTRRNESYVLRETQNLEAKQKIALEVARLVEDGSIIFLSVGTTPAIVASALKEKKRLTVVTNNLNAAMALSGEESNRIILPGGEMRLPDRDILGEPAVELIGRYRADFGIYGVGGIDRDGSLLDFHRSEVEIRSKVTQNSRTAILVADVSKFGRAAPAVAGHINDADIVVLDRQPGDDYQTLCEGLGDGLIIAGVA